MQKLLYISNGVQLEIDRVIVVPLEILNRHCRHVTYCRTLQNLAQSQSEFKITARKYFHNIVLLFYFRRLLRSNNTRNKPPPH
ncbi:hypothetical protein Avbf_15994 [Armadillidium vulgare]|nr:hypothetical protein Avbf_15994 [Armadillidium vulgare]